MPADHSSWLKKRGGAPLQMFKRRWFELHGSFLYYFKTPHERPLGVIDLRGATVSDGPSGSPQPHLTFCISGPALSRKFFLVSETPEEKLAWVQHMMQNGVVSTVLCEEPAPPPAEEVQLDDFQEVGTIGKGSFGKVYLIRHKGDQKLYAMKRINNKSSTQGEKQVLEKLRHPFIVTLHHTLEADGCLLLVMQYLPGGELFGHIKKAGKFTPDRSRFYAAEVALALTFLHEHNIVYRDLKPENCVLDEDGHVVLTDFGLAKTQISTDRERALSTFCGTPEYLAPELLRGQGATRAVDWWSWGILLYEMLTGAPPFYDSNPAIMYNLILTKEFVYPADVPGPARAVLIAVLDRDQGTRLQDGEGVMRHSFFEDVDWTAMRERRCAPPFRPEGPPVLLEKRGSRKSGSDGKLSDPFQDFTWSGKDGEDEEDGGSLMRL
eukprot:Sspe_Gene.58302::Locus_31973_Transcript_1_1_Confidence_1.000_Length_1425::g.58302::m.58302